MNEENIYLNPHEDRIIGVIGNEIYFKAQHLDYIIVTTEQEYFKILKQYLTTKADFCKRYGHFCGVFGEFNADKFQRLKDDFIIKQPFEIEDDGINDGLEMRDVSYPIYFVEKFDKYCDMEHG